MTTGAIDPEIAEALAKRLFEAIEHNDHEALREVYSPEVRVWHNHDGHAQDIDTNLRVLSWLHRTLADRRYEQVVRQPTPTGFVEQHVLRGTTPNGEQINVPACLVVRIDGDRITRIDEYVDSAHLGPLTP